MTAKLDITSETCPMTFVRTLVALEALAQGERLEVLMRRGEPERNVPQSLREHGHRIVAEGPVEGERYRVMVEKGPGRERQGE